MKSSCKQCGFKKTVFKKTLKTAREERFAKLIKPDNIVHVHNLISFKDAKNPANLLKSRGSEKKVDTYIHGGSMSKPKTRTTSTDTEEHNPRVYFKNPKTGHAVKVGSRTHEGLKSLYKRYEL